jgi:hypothetical protein
MVTLSPFVLPGCFLIVPLVIGTFLPLVVGGNKFFLSRLGDTGFLTFFQDSKINPQMSLYFLQDNYLLKYAETQRLDHLKPDMGRLFEYPRKPDEQILFNLILSYSPAKTNLVKNLLVFTIFFTIQILVKMLVKINGNIRVQRIRKAEKKQN